MALSFIGKPISLISHSDVRYRGILAGIDPGASTIQLSNVYSMGTETRRPPTEFIPPVQEPYQYIIFRASEVKDLAVDEPAGPLRSVHDDPAVLGASAPAPNPAYSPYPAPTTAQQPLPASQPPPQPFINRQAPSTVPAQPPAQTAPTVPTNNNQQQRSAPQPQPGTGGQSVPPNRRTNSVHTAAASLETVERALGDLRVSNGSHHPHAGGRGGRRGHHGGVGGRGDNKTEQIKVPTTDFDFASSNAKFDKAALARPGSGAAGAADADEVDTNPSETEGGEGGKDEAKEKEKEKEKEKSAYNPQKSFFDSLSSSTHPSSLPNNGPGGGSGGNNDNSSGSGGYRGGPRNGGGRGGGRNRREEERERNVATFGEPGGVGLMGPGAYVGGWGGYGRRGGRPRRGMGPAGQGQTVVGR